MIFPRIEQGNQRREDDRGYLEVLYESDQAVLKRSFTRKHAFRGLHWQDQRAPQVKIFRIVFGAIVDFIVPMNDPARPIYHQRIGPEDGWVRVDADYAHGLFALADSLFEYFYDAYNKGLAKATGEVIGFLNSDDFYVSPDVISQVMGVFEDPVIEAVHADLVYVDAENTDRIRRHWKAWDFSSEDYRKGYIPGHPTVFVRRDTYEKVGGYDTQYRLAADYDFLLRCFYVHAANARHVPSIWVKMRTGGA